MSEIGSNGVDGAGRSERNRSERVERRRPSESRRPERREAPREEDRVDVRSREEVDNIERRARELAARVASEDDGRQEKLQRVRENLDEIVNSRRSHEKAAEALYADVLRDRN